MRAINLLKRFATTEEAKKSRTCLCMSVALWPPRRTVARCASTAARFGRSFDQALKYRGREGENSFEPRLCSCKFFVPMTTLPEGFEVAHTFSPGDLGELIRIHGIQNFADYGFNVAHEAYCARIAAEFIIGSNLPRSRAWLVKKETTVVGSILIIEREDNLAQLRLLFVDRSVRGEGVGRWLVEESVRYSRDAGFRGVYLWTVEGLDRAIRIYEAVGFRRTSESVSEGWGRKSVEVRFDLTFS